MFHVNVLNIKQRGCPRKNGTPSFSSLWGHRTIPHADPILAGQVWPIRFPFWEPNRRPRTGFEVVAIERQVSGFTAKQSPSFGAGQSGEKTQKNILPNLPYLRPSTNTISHRNPLYYNKLNLKNGSKRVLAFFGGAEKTQVRKRLRKGNGG